MTVMMLSFVLGVTAKDPCGMDLSWLRTAQAVAWSKRQTVELWWSKKNRRGAQGGNGCLMLSYAVYKINEKGVLVVCLEINRSLSFHYKIIKFQNQVKFGILNNTSKKAPFASPKSGPWFYRAKSWQLNRINTMEVGNSCPPFYSRSSYVGVLDHIVFDCIEHNPTTLHIIERQFYRDHLGTLYKMEAPWVPHRNCRGINYLSIDRSIDRSIDLSIYLSHCLDLSIWLSVCLSVYPSIHPSPAFYPS